MQEMEKRESMTEELRAQLMGVKLTKKEKLIAEFILDNFAEACFITSTEIARRLQVSDSSVIRFTRTLGYTGFMDFQRSIRKTYTERINSVSDNITIPSERLKLSIGKLDQSDIMESYFSNVLQNLKSCVNQNDSLSFERAAAIDLAGRNVFEAVRMSVTPKIIETPWISAVAIDGIEVKVIAKVTVRANLARLVGGAGEETIIARVGEGIVTTVGSSQSHKSVLENPDLISRTVLAKGLDSGTAFEILSIDIADVDIGRNIGAHLQIQQAEADKQIAQAKAEERRATAIAMEQEMKAEVERMKAKVVEAEAQVPMAMADALRSGNLGVMDYYKFQNVQADTKMKTNFADTDLTGVLHKEPPKDQK